MGKEVWADGYRSSEAYLLEVKHVEKPESSPFIKGSRCSEVIRGKIREKELDQFHRYAAILKDPATPAVGLEIILNDARAGSLSLQRGHHELLRHLHEALGHPDG